MYVSEWFMTQQRSQYAGEGYIASIICTILSFCFLFFVRTEVFFSKLTATNRLYLLIFLVFMGWGGVQTFLSCYRVKTPWYHSNFFPPPDYIRGPLMRDQGNNI